MRYLIVLLLFGLLASVAGDDEPITLYLAGDSTMAEKRPEKRPETGWGEVLQAFFDEAEVRVENHARNGRSTRTFIEEGRWQAIVDRLQAGDYVFIQFGHNDQSKEKADRYTPPEQYRANLIRFVHDVRTQQATPVLLTPVVRRRFDDEDQFYDVHGVYPDLVRSVTVEQEVPLIDMHRWSEDVLRQYGAEGSKALFLQLAPGDHPNYPDGVDDNTHFSPRGAAVMAGLAIEGIRQLGLGLIDFLKQPDIPDRTSVLSYDVIVDAAYEGTPGAPVDGTPTFGTIGEALEVVPEDNMKPFVIFIRAGRYYEKLSVDRPFVHLIGASQDSTILTYVASGDTPSPDGGTYGTRGSFTLRITAPDFRAEHLTIENGFDYPANAAKPDDDPTKVQSPQAVALMTTGTSDRAVFQHCTIRGYQDTLFADAGRQYFHQCRILGHVDFIFGAGQAVFDDCDIVSRNRVDKNPTGYVTAPSTPISYPYGFLFIDSRLVKETPDLPAGSVRLGRPWHPNADPHASGSAVFMRCYMDDHIGPEGYAPISGRNNAGERIWFEVGPASRFFEYENHGPGALASPERPRLQAEAAGWYTPEQVLRGWNPFVE
ncbi:MAG TPA: pectinesterase family protein [Rhodothermales bacterium]|nr:pectinesterase family protein [Rhodothermales bacterium]